MAHAHLTRPFVISQKVFFIVVVVTACAGILLSANIFCAHHNYEGFAPVSSYDSPSKCRWSRSSNPIQSYASLKSGPKLFLHPIAGGSLVP